jgi:hypothetical protein
MRELFTEFINKEISAQLREHGFHGFFNNLLENGLDLLRNGLVFDVLSNSEMSEDFLDAFLPDFFAFF